MLIGPSRTGELLEIGVLDSDGDQFVVHAMKLRHNWRRYINPGLLHPINDPRVLLPG